VEKITWNGKVLDTTKTSYGSLKASISGPVKYTLPEFGPWKVRDSLPEVLMSYPDTSLAWVDANHTSTHNDKTGTVPYLYADDYGFHTGSFIYRGRFNGTASGLNVTVYGGEAAGYSIYLNGKFITAYLGSSSNSGSSVVDFESDMFVASGPNVLAIVADTSGHDEGSGATSVRGIYKIHLINSTESGFTSWKLAGTAGGALGTYLDPIRGAYNEAGWQAERLGWHLPGYDDSLWAESNPSDGFKNATVRFYRTNVSLNVPEGHDASVVFSLENLGPNSAVRALLYVNGYQYGRFNPYVNTATEFPVPPGILNYNGDNIIGLLVWAQSTEGAAVSVNWSISELRESSFNANIDAKYLQPQWNSSRLEYA
jgi:beta-galactosidase